MENYNGRDNTLHQQGIPDSRISVLHAAFLEAATYTYGFGNQVRRFLMFHSGKNNQHGGLALACLKV